ncbi:helicase-related protein [Cardiobacterium hominis]|uniref:helicase-related protein n=1 Tax=Cardiobacterium hominis TaxID=2718 RepID=UPI0006612D51|nr:SNF2-related protein [Cardiobacterium hominis]
MTWNPGQLVRHIDDPAKTGTVTDQTRPRTSGTQYRVRWDNGRLDWHYASELTAASVSDDDPLELIRAGRYGRVDDLRQLLTHIHLAGRLANVIYAMGLTQTDFYPHQYKPLLTLLDSPANGLLIADEVGLGKTIEAGLIWTELRARHDMRRLLVVCPAMLREKWRFELSARFGVDAQIVNADALRQALERDEQRERAWIVSYQGIRVPSDWDANHSQSPSRGATARLADLLAQHAEQEPLLDLVIFDEAHYMRNENTGAWQTGSLLREVSAYQLMLSATPINLGSDDLFNILRLLDPDHFSHRDDFANIIEANRPIIAASDSVRNPARSAQHIMAALREVEASRWFAQSERVRHLIAEAETITDWTNERRIDIAAKLERLNLLAHTVSRTRKREVQAERVQRDAAIVPEAEMTPVERELYQAITEGTREYAQKHDIKHGFLLATPQRMVASSPAALLQSWHDSEPDRDALASLNDHDESEENAVEKTVKLKAWLKSRVLPRFKIADLRAQDSKFALFSQEIKRFLAEDPAAKAIVFTTFRGTARYLVERLAEEGIKTSLLMGGGEFDKEDTVSAFREDKKRRLLVCTDVASEGVDLQFCRLVINYDLPWNPMRIEQRIGRIDRIGQQAKRILIWNFVHKNTIDARILERLTARIGVFESALGETEAILGEVRKLEDALLSAQLTAAEEARMIAATELAIANVRRKQTELEREAIQLVAHGQQLLAQIEAARGDGKIITRHDIMRYVEGYLRKTPGCQFTAIHGKADGYNICLSAALAAELQGYLERENLLGKTALASGQSKACRFSDKITDKAKPGEEIIHRFHPLVRFLSRKIEEDAAHYPLYAAKVRTPNIHPGHYALTVRLANFSGVKEEEHLLAAAVALEQGSPLAPHVAEALLNAVRQHGNDWQTAATHITAEEGLHAAEQSETLLRAHYNTIKEEKRRENQDRADIQLQLLDDHIRKKSEGYENRIERHEEYAIEHGDTPDSRRRLGMANAERKKQQEFLARMETRRESILRKSREFAAESQEICTLLVDVI